MSRFDERTFEVMAKDCEIHIESPPFREMIDISTGNVIKRVHDGPWIATITLYVDRDESEFIIKDNDFDRLQERAFTRYEQLKEIWEN